LQSHVGYLLLLLLQLLQLVVALLLSLLLMVLMVLLMLMLMLLIHTWLDPRNSLEHSGFSLELVLGREWVRWRGNHCLGDTSFWPTTVRK